ncbi:hypothetical protein [Paraburkholderia bannensis]|uniref:hypothetical protein n=1 Tax=Paraburkholderia bannensis TaxID=765414 RepID=UPI002AB70917|nr:hypothetical protein [Paraburkholderia bannensis]
MVRKAWSPEEMQVLRDVSRNPISLRSQMHRLPGRTLVAAKSQASKCGIPLKGSRFWSPEEVEILKRIWAGTESLKVALARDLPGRDYHSARSEAQRLGLTADQPGGRTGREGYSWLLPVIVRILSAGVPMTVNQLASETGANPGSIGFLMREHHGKTFRIGAWARPIDKWTACWALGTEADVQKPAPKGGRAAVRAYRHRKQVRKHAAANVFASIAQQVAA